MRPTLGEARDHGRQPAIQVRGVVTGADGGRGGYPIERRGIDQGIRDRGIDTARHPRNQGRTQRRSLVGPDHFQPAGAERRLGGNPAAIPSAAAGQLHAVEASAGDSDQLVEHPADVVRSAVYYGRGKIHECVSLAQPLELQAGRRIAMWCRQTA